jgi:hypothetical protein
MQRIRSQMPVAEKVKLADYVIWNDGDLAGTESQVQRIHAALAAELELAHRLTAAPDHAQHGDGHAAEARRLAVLFPVDVGNRGRNEITPIAALRALPRRADGVEFLGSHWRRSGNFVFAYRTDADIETAETLGAEALTRALGPGASQVRCIARSFPELVRVDAAAPEAATTTPHGSVVLASRADRVIAVFLSRAVAAEDRSTGPLGKSIRVLSWPSARDVLCVYHRPGERGDVGQVTKAVIQALVRNGESAEITGTGRAIGVVRALIRGRGIISRGLGRHDGDDGPGTGQASEAVAERLRLALDMHGAGEALMRQTLKRDHPDADDAEIAARLTAWLQHRPGAASGDADGRPVSWPRARR